MNRLIDLTGQRIGSLTVLCRAENDKYGNVQWLCRCDCGQEVIRHSTNLLRGGNCSCGCQLAAISRANAKRTHGGRNTRLYSIWGGMRARCNNKNMTYYGARGITVCPEWDDFAAFRDWALSHGYTDSLTIDRIDFDGPYSPENCRWVTIKDQERNKRTNARLTFNGETHVASEWAEITGIPEKTILSRVKRGWAVGDALTTPVDERRWRKTNNSF